MPITDLTGTVWRFNSTINNIHKGNTGAFGYNYGTIITVHFRIVSTNTDGYAFRDTAYQGGGTASRTFGWQYRDSGSYYRDMSTLYNQEIIFLGNPTEYQSYYTPLLSPNVYISYTFSDFLEWLQANAVQVSLQPIKVKINNKVLHKVNNKNIKKCNALPAMSGKCVEQASGPYTVNVNDTLGDCSIYDGKDNTGTLLGTGSGTYTIESGYIYAYARWGQVTFYKSGIGTDVGNPATISENTSLDIDLVM